jgi:hypothetical protein
LDGLAEITLIILRIFADTKLAIFRISGLSIEGERLDEQQVRSSLARGLGISIDGFVTPNRSVEGIVHITLMLRSAVSNH